MGRSFDIQVMEFPLRTSDAKGGLLHSKTPVEPELALKDGFCASHICRSTYMGSFSSEIPLFPAELTAKSIITGSHEMSKFWTLYVAVNIVTAPLIQGPQTGIPINTEISTPYEILRRERRENLVCQSSTPWYQSNDKC